MYPLGQCPGDACGVQRLLDAGHRPTDGSAAGPRGVRPSRVWTVPRGMVPCAGLSERPRAAGVTMPRARPPKESLVSLPLAADAPAPLAGFASTKREILLTLKREGDVDLATLSRVLGLTEMA